MAYIQLDVDLDSFNDDDLIDEIENRGFFVSENELDKITLTKYEVDELIILLDKEPSSGHNILLRDKLFRWRNTL